MKIVFTLVLALMSLTLQAANTYVGKFFGDGAGLSNSSGTITYSSLPYSPTSLTNGVAPVVNVKLFGAMGDGVTDDTAAIQLAIDSANYSNGVPKTVWLPPGVYWIGGTNELKIRPNVGGNGNPGDRSAATNGYEIVGTPNGQSQLLRTNFTGALFRYAGQVALPNTSINGVRLKDLFLSGPNGSSNPNTNITAVGIAFGDDCGGILNEVQNCIIAGFKTGITATGEVGMLIAENMFVSNWWSCCTLAHWDSGKLSGNECLIGDTSGLMGTWTNAKACYYFCKDNGSNTCLGGSTGAGANVFSGEGGDYPYYTYNDLGAQYLNVFGGNIERLHLGVNFAQGALVNNYVNSQAKIQDPPSGTNWLAVCVLTNLASKSTTISGVVSGAAHTSNTLALVIDASYNPPVVLQPDTAHAEPCIAFTVRGSATTNYYHSSNPQNPYWGVPFVHQTSGAQQFRVGADTNAVGGATTITANTDKYWEMVVPQYSASFADTTLLSFYGGSGANIIKVGAPNWSTGGQGNANYFDIYTSGLLAWRVQPTGNLVDGGTHSTMTVGNTSFADNFTGKHFQGGATGTPTITTNAAVPIGATNQVFGTDSAFTVNLWTGTSGQIAATNIFHVAFARVFTNSPPFVVWSYGGGRNGLSIGSQWISGNLGGRPIVVNVETNGFDFWSISTALAANTNVWYTFHVIQ
jgi:hypothetical protein